MVWSNRLVTALLACGGLLSASCFLVLPRAFAGWNGIEAQPQTSAARPAAAPDYGKLPISFEANQGQSDTQVKFLSHGHGYSLFLTDSAAVLALEKRNPPRRGSVRTIHSAPDVVRMEIVGAQTAQVSGAAPLPGVTNYFIGNDPAKWQRDVRTYAQVKYQGVYPGIDLLYYGNQQQLEYDFVVAPGADPQPIRLHFAGARRVKLAGNGDLQIRGKDGAIAFRKPVVYQLKDGVREPVEGQFALLAKNTVGFRVGAFDHQRELVIDPTLAYSTYLGGGTGSGIAIDQTGNAYVAGSTDSTNFPVTSGAFQKTNGGAACGNFNAFVTKLNPEGSALVYSTYLGGVCDGSAGLPSVTFADDVAVDSAGNAYITGSDHSGSFPVTSDAFQKVNHAANIGGRMHSSPSLIRAARRLSIRHIWVGAVCKPARVPQRETEAAALRSIPVAMFMSLVLLRPWIFR